MAPKEVLDAITQSKDLTSAYTAAGNFLYSEADLLDLQYKRAQIAKIQNELATGGSGLDVANAIAYANEYAATGKIPSGIPKGTFGTIAQIAKELPKQKGQIFNATTGVTPTGDTTLQTALTGLYSATELAKQLKELDKQRYEGIISGSLGKVFGSDAQQRYVDLRTQIIDLLARARTGAALTASEEKHYASMLPSRFSEPLGLGADSEVRIDNFINTLTSDLQNKAAAQGWAINGVSKVKLGGTDYTVGDIIQSPNGQTGRVNADGSITLIQ